MKKNALGAWEALKNTRCLWLTGESRVEARVRRLTGGKSRTCNDKAGFACKPRRARPVAHRGFVAPLAKDNQPWPSRRASPRHATGHAEALGIFQSFPCAALLLSLSVSPISSAYTETGDDAGRDTGAMSANAILAERNRRVADGFRLAALQRVTEGEQTRFVPLWKKNSDHLTQRVRFDLSREAFADAKRRYQHQGYRVLWSQEYSVGSALKIAVIWEEYESAKVQFRHRVAFEKAIEEYRRQHSSGLVVAAARRGTALFTRGYGDLHQQAVYADTVFPVLAASQAIAGVLAARLEQEKHTAAGIPINLSLDWAVADLLPMMPANAAYSARHVFAHSACVDNQYVDSSVLQGDRVETAAYHLASTVWSRSPIAGCIPGYLQFYSQPAYLLLAAFLEAATGQTIDELLNNEISQRFGLASIKPSLAGSDNILGLGIQANALDLAQLINGVLDGTVLSARTTHARLWKPVSQHSEFGLGWRLDGRRYAEARDDTAASSVRVWVDRQRQSVIVILASESTREHLDALLGSLRRLL